ncbi:hypothetical protein [Saezia sanguinis]|uniref:hypothetical protein n=1 Tax=Saezia sanguinis TaxID=1965230 RepID=UPI00303DDB5B
MKKSIFACLFLGAALAGCTTLSGEYIITAHDQNGNPVSSSISSRAQGKGIYTVRDAICSAYPNAIVVIKNAHTGEELEDESPYQCK